ncbi:MAG: S-methyl-5-thioribose-1-phosphate isomerase, partial [Eggerthellaceae bacterium]|nr:S-methyl-5-thioribose-1-phosphate isomerase [Eggerthellaceae bacterium]
MNIRFAQDGAGVDILDQTALPSREIRRIVRTKEECWEAIELLQVRGAPAIGIFAAFSLAVLARTLPMETPQAFQGAFDALADYLESSRPTAVNLHWACKRMKAFARDAVSCAAPNWDGSRELLLSQLRGEAQRIQDQDVVACKFMAVRALSRIRDNAGIITHCNAGPLATSCYGTALGPLILGAEQGMKFRVYVDETRPLLQGARLTAYELQRAGIDTTLICDNMASSVMTQGLVDACFVGADRVAANGDVANKIGTSQLAIVAAHYGIPFYVVCPTSTIDRPCATGDDLP